MFGRTWLSSSTVIIEMKKLALIFLSMILSACGGGEDTGGLTLTYGSIAVNQANGRAGISANYSSESAADNGALSQCGDSCVIVFRFGPYQCGSLSRSNTAAVFGWSSNSSKSAAEANSLNECQRNAANCTVRLSECNG